jgi:hypothetical protein
MDMTTKTAALVLGIIFVLVGLLGFVNNPIIGLFAVDTAHNLVHLASGILILIGAYTAIGAGTTLKVFGVIYAIVAILGFFTSNGMLLGFIANNTADTWLHVVLAIVILYAGFMLTDEKTA